MDVECSQAYVNSLLNCLQDTYETNQQKALSLLSTLPAPYLDLYLSKEKLRSVLSTAQSFLTSCRPQDSLAASYLFQVLLLLPERSIDVVSKAECLIDGSGNGSDSLSKREQLHITLLFLVLNVLREQARKAASDLVDASQSGPLYPSLLCIRYLLRAAPVASNAVWQNVILVIMDITQTQVCPVVSPIVCHSSPEGYIPPEDADLDGIECDFTRSPRPSLPQFLVVCCWRTVKEISLLYATIMQCISGAAPSLIVSRQQVIDVIKSFYEDILLTAKHRGAFEMSFTGYCEFWKIMWRLQSSEQASHTFLTDGPYSQLLDKTAAENLCATRRSAGLPFMILAFLSSEPQQNQNQALRRVMADLLAITQEQDEGLVSSTQRVHAKNVLRALFKDSILGEAVQPFVPAALRSAMLGYKSQVWAVRNAATLLYSTLITRMFGVKHGKDDLNSQTGMAGRLFFQKYRELHGFLLEEIKTSTVFYQEGKSLLQPSLFLVLLLLCKLFPSQKEGADRSISLTQFVPYILKCAESPVLKARTLSAKALSNVVSHDDMASTMSYLSRRMLTLRSHNALHGTLLQIQALLCGSENSLHLASCLEELTVSLSEISSKIMASECGMVKSAFMETLISLSCRRPVELRLLTSVYDACCLSVSGSGVQLPPDIDTQRSACALLWYMSSHHELPDTETKLLQILMSDFHYEAQEMILKNLTSDLKDSGKSPVSTHALLNAFIKRIVKKDFGSHCGDMESLVIWCEAAAASSIRSPPSADVAKSIIPLCAKWMAASRTESAQVSAAEFVSILLNQTEVKDEYLSMTNVCLDTVHQALVTRCMADNTIKCMHVLENCAAEGLDLTVFWKCLILLLLHGSCAIRELACVSAHRIFTKHHQRTGYLHTTAAESHSSVQRVLNCMQHLFEHSVRTSELLTIWSIWREDSWRASTQEEDVLDSEDRVFDGCADSLLVDPDYLLATINNSCSKLMKTIQTET